MRLRHSAPGLALVAALLAPLTVYAAFPLSNDAPSLAVCQETVREAGLRLADQVHRAMSTCLSGGVDCSRQGGTADCCGSAARRCTDELAGIAKAQERFVTRVTNGRCAAVPFEDVLSPAGLGYAQRVVLCAELDPPLTVTGVDDLARCIASLIVADTAHLVAASTVPGANDALTCLGLDAGPFANLAADPPTCSVEAAALRTRPARRR